MYKIRKKINDIISFYTLRKIRNILLICLNNLGINDFFRLMYRKKMIILLYHGISKKKFSFSHKRYLPLSLFLKEIKYINKKKYKFITLTEWIEIVKTKKKIKHRYITLTFDDGFKNVVENAYPIMKQYGAKGCLYLVSDLIGTNKLIWADYIDVLVHNHKFKEFKFQYKDKFIEYLLNSELEIRSAISNMKDKIRLLNYYEKKSHLEQFYPPNNIKNFKQVPKDYLIVDWQDIKSIDTKILEIGCHTKTHPKLEILNSENEFYEELYQSKKILENHIGNSIIHLCYPAGSYNEVVINYVKKYGYITGVTINNGFNTLKTDLLQLKRLNLENDYVLFKFKVSGFYSFAKKWLKLF